MGRYDKTDDSNGRTSIALWKPTQDFPADTLYNFSEQGTDDNPMLHCEDINGKLYVLHGAWVRNVKLVVKEFGSDCTQWEGARLQVSKTGTQIELRPIYRTVKLENV